MGRRYNIMRDEAIAAKGRDWRNLIMTIEVVRVIGPWVLLGALLGAVGWAAHHLWVSVTSHAPHPHTATLPVAAAHAFAAMPGWLWIAAAVLAAVAVWLFRPGRVVTPSGNRMRVVQVCAIVIVFAGLFGVGLSMATA